MVVSECAVAINFCVVIFYILLGGGGAAFNTQNTALATALLISTF